MDDREALVRLTRTGLLIPHRMNDEPRYRCNVPGCDAVFYDGEERARVNHALLHAGDEDRIAELTYSPMDDLLGEGDPEYREYLRRRFEQLKGEVGPKEALNPDRY
jgi:hypothetical protein